jgi:opacity protein-like surface antigen
MSSTRFRLLGAAAFLAVVLVAAPAATAQDAAAYMQNKGMDERFRLDLGGFFQKFETTLRLDSTRLGTGTEVSFEDDLGLGAHQTNFRADGYWRFGRHGSLRFGFLLWNRTNTHTIDRDIQAGDHVYHAGATLDTALRVRVAQLYYSYSFVNNGKVEAGAMIGFSTFFNSASLEGTGNITGPDGEQASGSASKETRDFVAPIPALGLHGQFTIVPKLFVRAYARGFKIIISGFTASEFEAFGGLDYYPWKNVGIGAGYNYVELKFSHQADRTVAFKYTYSGPLTYITIAF